MTLRLALEIGGDATGAKVALGDTVGAINQLTAAEARMNTSVHAERGRDIAAFGAELDKLRAKYNPIFALSKQYETELNGINRAHQLGAISTREQASALDHLNAQYQAMAVASSTAGTATAATTMQSRQLMFQMVDLGQTIPLAMQSPIFALQNVGFQVAQIGQLYYGQGGMRAALTDMTSMAGRFVAAIGPWPLAIGAAAGAGALFFSSVMSGADRAEAALERHEDLIGRIRDAWPEAGESVQAYAAESLQVLKALRQESIDQTTEALRREAEALLKDVDFFLPDFRGMVHPGAEELRAPLEAFFRSVEAGRPEVAKLRDSVSRLINDMSQTEHVRALGHELLAVTSEADKLDRSLTGGANSVYRMSTAAREAMREVEAFGDALAKLSGIDPRRFTPREEASRALQDAVGSFQGPDDAAAALAEYQATLGRISEAERRLAAERAERDAERRAGARERETERFFGGMESVRGEIEAMRIEAATFGLAEAAAARYRVEQELIAAAHQAGVPVTDDLRNSIAGLAQEYGAATADLARLADEQERFDQNRDLARGFFQDMRSGFQEGASLADTFANSLSRIADRLAEIATDDLLDVLLGAQGSSGTGLIGTLIGSVFGGVTASADGNVFNGGRLQAFAAGGVVDRPTFFPMANGAGLMGEAGPEAIMPLKRGANGRLGVEASGGGQPVVVNYSLQIDARGADSEGLARVERQIERDRRELPRRVLETVREARSRVVPGF